MRTLPSALFPWFVSLALAQAPGEPVFTTGDLTKLSCRVVATKPVDGNRQLLTVEVHNQGATAAEPLEFRIELPQKKPAPPLQETFARAQLPHVARHGRPTPAGGKLTYLVSTAMPGKKGQFTVSVAGASFFTGDAVPKPDLAFGKPEQVQRTSLAGTFPVTQVALQNPFAADLDVLMLVHYEQPQDLVELVGVRLAANARRDLLIATRPGRDVFLDPLMEDPGTAVKATSFQVVDWCLVGTASPDAAIGGLREAYQAWYRWPEADAAVAGDFTFRERRRIHGVEDRYEDFLVEGRFTLSSAGAIEVQIVSGKGANASFLLRDALANLRRPDFATLAEQNALKPVTADRVALVGPGWHLIERDAGRHRVDGTAKAEESPDLEVRGGRIVSDGRGPGERTRWEFQEVAGAAVVTRRTSASTDSRYSYAVVEGRIVPVAAASVVTLGDKVFSAAELTLARVRCEGVVPLVPPPPTGAGVAALRALWDATYRLPSEPIVVEAKFDIALGNDGVWRGRSKLSGSVVMEGVGRHLRRSDWRFDAAMAREDEVQMAALLRDRLLMWYGVDWNDRAPFDEFWRGAVIHAPDATGTFAVENRPYDRVFSSGGLVRGLRGKGGGATKFTYAKVGDRQVVTRIDQQFGGPSTPAALRWDAVTLVTLAPVGDHLLPTRIVFQNIFGREWQPETLVFRDLRVRAP